MWQKRIKEIAAQNNMEIISENETIYFVHPRKIDETIKSSILKEVPEKYKCDFSENPKPSTKIMLNTILNSTGNWELSQSGRQVTINITANIPDNEFFFNNLDKIFRSDGYFDFWKIIINNSYENTGYYISLEKSKRNTVIQKDEITNLIITLKTTDSVQEFLKQI